MNKQSKSIGLKKNLDKVMFILAAGYLITVAAWLIRQEKLKSLVVLSNSTEDLPSLENNSDQAPEKELILAPAEEAEGETTSDSALYSMINQPIAQLPSLTPVASINDRQISNSSSITAIAPLTSDSRSSLLSPAPLKVPIPPPSKHQPPSKLPLVPALDSKNNNSIVTPNNIAFPPSTAMTTARTSHTLVGLIELEDNKSAALFNINDLTHRVQVGEEIGTSGCILLSIIGKQVEINRQGELVYLTVGEKF